MSNSDHKKKVFIISTKNVETLFEKTISRENIIFNGTNYKEHPIIDVYNRSDKKLTLYDFFLNFDFEGASASFYEAYITYLENRKDYFKEESIIQDFLDNNIQTYVNKNQEHDIERSSKYFGKIFQLEKPSNNERYIFLARCFPHKLIELLIRDEIITPNILTNHYWLVCYINSVMSICSDDNPDNYEFYAILHNRDFEDKEKYHNKKEGVEFQITTYDSKTIKFKKLFTYSHQGEEKGICDEIINNASIFDGLKEATDACDYLLEKLYGTDGLGSRIELLKKSGLKKMNDQDYMFVFNCKKKEIDKKKEEYKKNYGDDIEKLFV